MQRIARRPILICWIVIGFLSSYVVSPLILAEQITASANTPTFANVAYGQHARHCLDFWNAKGEGPRPMVVFIHGGGWNGGDKADIPKKLLSALLDHGISVASINYRYTSMALIPGPLHDGARAIQFLRSHASDWNVDAERIGAYGVSAGGCSAMWLAFHDDLADPQNSDPVLRRSTRLRVAVGISPQTTLEPDVLVDWVGEEVLKHPMIHRAIGYKKGDQPTQLYVLWKAMLRECSPIHHVSADDPPTMFAFPRVDELPAETPGSAIHHAIFGMKLKSKADSCKLECRMRIEATAEASTMTPEAFLIEHLIQREIASTK